MKNTDGNSVEGMQQASRVKDTYEGKTSLVKVSQTKESPHTVSILFLASCNGALSFTSVPEIHDFTCSRRRCSFLMSRFRSASNLSFWLLVFAVRTLLISASNSAMPSLIFFMVRSISPKESSIGPKSGCVSSQPTSKDTIHLPTVLLPNSIAESNITCSF